MKRLAAVIAAFAALLMLCSCSGGGIDYADSGAVVTLELSPGLGDPDASYKTIYVVTAEGMAYLRGELYREGGSLTLPQTDKSVGTDAVAALESFISDSGFTSLPQELDLAVDKEHYAVITVTTRSGERSVRGREDCNTVFADVQKAVTSLFSDAETTGFHTVAKAFVKGK